MTHAGHRAYKKVDQRNPVILKFDPWGEFSHDSANEMQAFLCIRCSKIWKSQKKSLYLQSIRGEIHDKVI